MPFINVKTNAKLTAEQAEAMKEQAQANKESAAAIKEQAEAQKQNNKEMKEAFENLGVWDEVSAKASFGTNVTEVLSWVAEGSADAGVVYLTDATTSDQADKIDIIGYAPEGSCKKVIYPVGIVSASEHKEAAAKFIEYLQTEEGLAAFEKYGFSSNVQ
jgi:molybdate transport system substrate-binding protein